MGDEVGLELAARAPWTVAEGGTLWIATGRRRNGDTFDRCLLRCVPEWIHGAEAAVFETLLFGGAGGETDLVTPGEITTAREVFLVYANDPLTAVDPDDQPTVDHAVRDRGVG